MVLNIPCKTAIGKLLWILFICFIPGIKQVYPAQYEAWTFAGVNTQWKDIKISLINANYFEQKGHWFHNHTDINLDFPSKGKINFGMAYKQEYIRFADKLRKESRPIVHLYYKRNMGLFQFQDRNRMEFRFMEKRLYYRYRNMVQVSYHLSKSFDPYLSSELFLNINHFDYVKQRSLIGTKINLNRIMLNFFFGQQFEKDLPHHWVSKMILGTALNYRITKS